MATGEIVTILFTDIVGSTELSQRLGDDPAEDFRRRHFALLRVAVQGRGGHEVKNLGDGLMVVLTITGPGGVGKTRLSGHLVDAVAPRYPDGVWCCALASVRADEQVPEAVATALRVERRTGVSLEDRLVEFLAAKTALLVLENCEQIIDGAAGLSAAVLGGTAGIDVLATSREPLGLPGEHRVPLEPLLLSEAHAAGTAPAVALFLQRATAANAGFEIGDDSLRVVDDLCRRVDGLPLAIELAAARVATHTVHEILADVTERLGELSVRRGRTERHRSIAAVVEWSYDLLGETDQRLFERLAVFAGGWNADAAAAVADAASGGRVVDQLDRLVDQSLVSTRTHERATRYALLEPVRAYAEHRLRQRGGHDDARAAHARFFVALAEQADRGLHGPDEARWMTRLDQELANLRAAHGWLMHRGDTDGALRLAGTLFWYGHGAGVSEVYAWAEQAAERFATSGHPGLAEAPVVGEDAARLSAVMDRLHGELGEEALARHRERGALLGDTDTLSYAVEVLRAVLGSTTP